MCVCLVRITMLSSFLLSRVEDLLCLSFFTTLRSLVLDAVGSHIDLHVPLLCCIGAFLCCTGAMRIVDGIVLPDDQCLSLLALKLHKLHALGLHTSSFYFLASFFRRL